MHVSRNEENEKFYKMMCCREYSTFYLVCIPRYLVLPVPVFQSIVLGLLDGLPSELMRLLDRLNRKRSSFKPVTLLDMHIFEQEKKDEMFFEGAKRAPHFDAFRPVRR